MMSLRNRFRLQSADPVLPIRSPSLTWSTRMSNRQLRKTSLSRRQFVKAASVAVAAPMIIPSGVLGNAQVPAANSRLGVGFIGMGKQVGGHVGAMLGNKGVNVLAVCDVYQPRREYFR